jgi:hypothetical protein
MKSDLNASEFRGNLALVILLYSHTAQFARDFDAALAVVYNTAVMAEADLKLLACIVALSSLLGAIAGVGAQQFIAHRRTILLSASVLCTGALARGLAASFAAFTAGVVVDGVGMGMFLMIVPAYAAELSPSSVRGVLASHPDGLLYLGCILGSLCYSTGVLKLAPHAAWQVTVASGTAIPALISSVVLLMPESPRWLVAKGQVSKARRVLARTSATLEEAEVRFLEIKAELCHTTQDGSPDEAVTMVATRSWWTECGAVWRELLARPTEPLRRAVITAVVAKVFQQASGIGSLAQYVDRAFRDVGVTSSAQVPRALAAFGFVVVLSLSTSLVLVELGWQLVRPLARCCYLNRRAASSHRVGMTRRQEQLKWAMLLSLMALAWIAFGPAQWASASRGCPRWLRATAAAVNEAISSAILSCFVRVYKFSAVYGNLVARPAVAGLVLLCFCACLLGARR